METSYIGRNGLIELADKIEKDNPSFSIRKKKII
jgi:hypothetical protein